MVKVKQIIFAVGLGTIAATVAKKTTKLVLESGGSVVSAAFSLIPGSEALHELIVKSDNGTISSAAHLPAPKLVPGR